MEHPDYPEYAEYAEYRGPQRTSPDALIEMSPAMMPSHGLTLPHCGIDTQLPSPARCSAAIALGLPPTGTPAQPGVYRRPTGA